MTQTTAANGTTGHKSFSQVRQFRQCGWQFKLERIDRVPSRPSAPAVAGVSVHVGTETVDHLIHEAGREATPSQALLKDVGLAASLVKLDEEIERLKAKGWEPETWKRFGRKTNEKPNAEDIEWFRHVGIPNSINAYVDWRVGNPEFELVDVPGFGVAIEVPFNYYISGQLVHGFIDRIFTHTEHGGYYPLDIKSGLKPKTSEQLALYGGALREALGWTIEWGYYLYGLKSGEAKLTAPIGLSSWTDELLGQVYLPATEAINQQLFIPNPGDSCFICSVSDSCAFVQALV